MIVESIEEDPPNNWRRQGARFAVQEVYARLDGKAKYRVEANGETPTLIPASNFKLIDGSIPITWTVSETMNGGSLVFGPTQWRSPEFWDRWMEHDEDARNCYRQLRSTLEQHDPIG